MKILFPFDKCGSFAKAMKIAMGLGAPIHKEGDGYAFDDDADMTITRDEKEGGYVAEWQC